MLEPTVLFYFLLFLCQRELKIRHGCQFVSSLIRALAKLPGGFGYVFALRSWFSHVQVKAFGLGSVFSWFDL